MELTVLNRLTLLQLLPPHGDLTMMRLVRDLQDVLGFSEEEHDVLKFVDNLETQRTTWEQVDLRKDVHVSKRMHVFFVDKLRELEKDGELTLAQLDLWDILDCDNFDSTS